MQWSVAHANALVEILMPIVIQVCFKSKRIQFEYKNKTDKRIAPVNRGHVCIVIIMLLSNVLFLQIDIIVDVWSQCNHTRLNVSCFPWIHRTYTIKRRFHRYRVLEFTLLVNVCNAHLLSVTYCIGLNVNNVLCQCNMTTVFALFWNVEIQNKQNTLKIK